MGKAAKKTKSAKKKSAKTNKLKLRKGDEQKFRRLARRARKAGLLVSREAYIRYFKDPSDATKSR